MRTMVCKFGIDSGNFREESKAKLLLERSITRKMKRSQSVSFPRNRKHEKPAFCANSAQSVVRLMGNTAIKLQLLHVDLTINRMTKPDARKARAV